MIARAARWLWLALLLLLVLGVLGAVATVFVLDTERGTGWLISRVEKAVPGSLEITEFDGTLWQGLQIDRLTYQDDKQKLEIGDITLDLNWPALLAGRLVFKTLRADVVSRHSLKARPPEPEPFTLAMNPLPVYIGVEQGSVNTLLLEGVDTTREIAGLEVRKLSISGNRFRAARVTGSMDGVLVNLENLATALRGPVPVSARIGWRLDEGAWSGQGKIGGNLRELELQQEVGGPYPATVGGTLKILGNTEPFFDVRISWERWGIAGQDLEEGEINAAGTRRSFDAEYAANLLVADRRLRISGSASGNSEVLTTVNMRVAGPGGEVDLSGQVTRKPEFSAAADATAREIDLSEFHSQLQGRLRAAARLSIDKDYVLTVRDLDADGTLHGASVAAKGGLIVSKERLGCAACVITVGSNRMTIDGENAGDSLRLDLQLKAPDLAQLSPEIAGEAVGNASVRGSFGKPRVNGRLNLRGFAYRDTTLGDLAVSLTGSQAAADVEAHWTYEDLAASAAGQVRIADEQISGRIEQATVTRAEWDSWELQGPFEFRVAESLVSLGASEWQSDLGNVRIAEFSRSGDALDVAATAENIPLAFINPGLPPNYRLSGVASADLDLNYTAGMWTGTVNWEQANTVLRVIDETGDSTDVVVRRAEAKANFRNGGVEASASVQVDPGVTGEIDVELQNLKRNAPMIGSLRLRGEDWSWISAVVPQIDRFTGAISADIKARGPLDSPAFSGTANWVDGSVLVPASNVLLKEIELEVQGAPNGEATVTGSARAGGGTLQLNGRLQNLTRESRSATFTIRGENAELIDWPEYHVWGSPDIELSGRPGSWQLQGKLNVPRAELSVPEKPAAAVTESPDVIVLGEEKSVDRSQKLTVDARIILGDRVHFEALGLDTRLVGNILVRQTAGDQMTAEGRVKLVEGSYEAYGKELTIEEGELTFTGPLDNPLVNVKAVRVIESVDGTVTAGVHLRGRAQNLTTTMYSKPAMPDAQALAYLVLGRPLDQAMDSDGFEVSNAAIALGIRQAGRITDEIGENLGLDELSLAGDGGDTTALVAGKQINSRLHARYAYGVFSRLGTLLLRYRISRHLTLEAGAGEHQSLEILYSIEK